MVFKLCTLHFVGFIYNSYRAGGAVLETHLFSNTISLVNTTKPPSFRWESKYRAFNQPLFLYSSRLWPFSVSCKDRNWLTHLDALPGQITGKKIESWTTQPNFTFQSESFQVRFHVINSELIRSECSISVWKLHLCGSQLTKLIVRNIRNNMCKGNQTYFNTGLHKHDQGVRFLAGEPYFQIECHRFVNRLDIFSLHQPSHYSFPCKLSLWISKVS